MSTLRCRLRTLRETVTLPAFWRSLLHPPLVVFSGHRWPEPAWSDPAPSRFPDDWPGLVQVDLSQCVDCGHRDEPVPWRRFYGGPS